MTDYKFFCFGGIPKIVYISKDKAENPTTDFFDMDYTHLPIRMRDPKPAKIRGHAISPLFTRAHLYTVAGAVRPAGGVAYFVRDGKLRSPNPLCALRSQTPTLHLSGSTEPEISPPKGGATHRFLPYSRQYHQAQRGPFCRCRSCLPQRNQADK